MCFRVVATAVAPGAMGVACWQVWEISSSWSVVILLAKYAQHCVCAMRNIVCARNCTHFGGGGAKRRARTVTHSGVAVCAHATGMGVVWQCGHDAPPQIGARASKQPWRMPRGFSYCMAWCLQILSYHLGFIVQRKCANEDVIETAFAIFDVIWPRMLTCAISM